MTISVIVPSKGRPESFKRLIKAFEETCQDSTYLICVVDVSDPELEAYRKVYDDAEYHFLSLWVVDQTIPGIVQPLNEVVKAIHHPRFGFYPSIIGFMGDDHLPKTLGWDIRVELEMAKLRTGIIYGNDLLQGEALPTAAFVSADIVSRLGYMAPPSLHHLYVDNFWLDLGTAIKRLKYLPELIFEHLHFTVGKSPKDATYAEANDPNIEHDRIAYKNYCQLQLALDAVKLLKLIQDDASA